MSNKDIHDKLDRLDSRLDNIDATLIRQEVILAEHVKRSTNLENDMKPVRRHVYMVQGVGAFIGLLALVATIWVAFKS